MRSVLVSPSDGTDQIALCVPRDVGAVVAEWSGLRRIMARRIAPEFTRDEWAYLIQFLDAHQLESLVRDVFAPTNGASRLVFRPRSPVAVWLPNNVSLLGPLVVVMLSLGGARMLLKAGSRSEDLTSSFVEYARHELGTTALGAFLRDEVELAQFDRDDPRNAEFAAAAQMRIVFGADSAVAAIDALPHPANSVGVGFSDRQSEAWIDTDAAQDDEVLHSLLKVFAIYGQAGCTSPRRVVVLEGTDDDALRVRDRLVDLWSSTIRDDPPMHVASENVMARQWAAALGWDAMACHHNAAVIAQGSPLLSPINSLRTLFVVAADVDLALETMPANIQTVGLSFARSKLEDDLIVRMVDRGVARVVPLWRMHHFGPQWDGYELLRLMFESVVIES